MDVALLLLGRFIAEHPVEAARAIERAPAPEAAAILADEDPDRAAETLRHMAIPAAAAALGRMEAPSSIALLCRLTPARAALLLRRQNAPTARALLHACPDPWQTHLTHAYHVGALTAGALMNRVPVALPLDWTVRETGHFLMAHPVYLHFDVFVTDRDWKLAGRTDLLRLASTNGARTIGGIMQPNPARLSLRASIAAVREDALWRTHDVLPVTDSVGLLVGSLAHRQLRSFEETSVGDAVEPGTLLVEAAELAWTGYVAAIEAASSWTRQADADDEGPL